MTVFVVFRCSEFWSIAQGCKRDVALRDRDETEAFEFQDRDETFEVRNRDETEASEAQGRDETETITRSPAVAGMADSSPLINLIDFHFRDLEKPP